MKAIFLAVLCLTFSAVAEAGCKCPGCECDEKAAKEQRKFAEKAAKLSKRHQRDLMRLAGKGGSASHSFTVQRVITTK